MAIDPVVKETSPVPSAGTGQAAATNLLILPQPAVKDPPSVGDQVFVSRDHDATFQEIQQVNEHKNAQAAAIRDHDRSLAQLGQKIDHLKAPLAAIVKNYPPFSPEDKARMQLLMQYSALRKEIEQLVFPPPPEVVAARKPAALPAPLAMDATDRQIADHVAKLDATSVAVSDARAGLAADTSALVQGGGFSQIFPSPNIAKTGTFPVDLSESAAAEKSGQVGRQFAFLVSQGVTAASSQFLKGLS